MELIVSLSLTIIGVERVVVSVALLLIKLFFQK